MIFTGANSFSASAETVASGAKYIVCAGTAENTAVWVGGESGTFSTAANWHGENLPQTGWRVILANGTAATLENDIADFAPGCIEFPAATAQITLTGNAISGLLAVTNRASGVHHVFSNAVAFAENTVADLLAASSSGNYVVFDGGATMHLPPMDPSAGSSRAEATGVWLAGDITITGEIEDWSPGVSVGFLRQILRGTLTIPHAVTVKGVPNFLIGADCSLHIEGDLTVNCTSGTGYFMNFANGTMILDGWAINAGTVGVRFSEQKSGVGYIYAYGIKSTGTATVLFNGGEATGAAGRWCIGAGGIPAGTQVWVQDQKSSYVEASADFTIAGDVRLSSSASNYHPYLYVNPDGHTVVFNHSNIGGNTRNSSIIAHGSGTVEVRRTMSAIPASEFLANDTVTVAALPGLSLGKGAVGVAAGATLKVLESGTLNLSGNSSATLADGATLAFNFTEKGTAPAIVLPAATTVSGAVNVSVFAEAGVRPKSGAHTIVSGYDFTGTTVALAAGAPHWAESVEVDEDGEIVLNVKPMGFVMSVR